MAAIINRWIAGAFQVLAWVLLVFAVVMGSFGWLNSGFRAGLGIYFISGILAAVAGLAALLFGFVARLHAAAHPHRWAVQVGSIFALYLIFGLAASATTLLD